MADEIAYISSDIISEKDIAVASKLLGYKLTTMSGYQYYITQITVWPRNKYLGKEGKITNFKKHYKTTYHYHPFIAIYFRAPYPLRIQITGMIDANVYANDEAKEYVGFQEVSETLFQKKLSEIEKQDENVVIPLKVKVYNKVERKHEWISQEKVVLNERNDQGLELKLALNVDQIAEIF